MPKKKKKNQDFKHLRRIIDFIAKERDQIEDNDIVDDLLTIETDLEALIPAKDCA